MKRHTLTFVCLTFLIACTALATATPRQAILVDSAWLKQHLADPDIVLLHIGNKEGYDEGHIPGARLVSLGDVSVSDHSGHGLMLEMLPADELHNHLEALGISDKSHVIVYFAKDWVSPATRVVFTLDYAGLGSRSSLLDGGQEAWARNGGSVTKEVTPAKSGKLSPLKLRPIVVDAATVHARIGTPGVAVVDGRDAVYYDGVETGGAHGETHRTGHVHGALSIPFTSITDDHLMIKSPEELAALFTKAGVKSGDTVIGYCHIGQQTTAMLFAARSLGHQVLLYDGSFEDWSRHREYAVDNPSDKAAK